MSTSPAKHIVSFSNFKLTKFLLKKSYVLKAKQDFDFCSSEKCNLEMIRVAYDHSKCSSVILDPAIVRGVKIL